MNSYIQRIMRKRTQITVDETVVGCSINQSRILQERSGRQHDIDTTKDYVYQHEGIMNQCGFGLFPIDKKTVEGEKQPGISVIHLDPYINCLPDYYGKLLGETILPNYCMADKAKCLKQIKEEFKNDRIFLLSSGFLAREIVPEIHALPQLHAIYILCGDVAGNRRWSMQYEKVRVVAFDERRDRFPQFAIDLAQTYEDFGDYQVTVGRKDRAKARYEKARTILAETSALNFRFLRNIEKKLEAMLV